MNNRYKGTNRALLTTVILLATTSLSGFAERLVPAGTLIQCTVSETKLSSKTVAIGDPVLCQVSRSSIFPSGSVLSGTFEDYKDPGHLVGKGWMELVFDRMIFPSNNIVQVNSKVVAVPHYSVDLEGKILGKGHATRDTIEWLIPVLWPIDVLNLPRRGPRPTLKSESRITIKVMDDLVVPDMAPTIHKSNGFAQRAEPISYSAPVEVIREQRQVVPQRVMNSGAGTTFILTDGSDVHASGYGYTGGHLKYRSLEDGAMYLIDANNLDLEASLAANRQNGIEMKLPDGRTDFYNMNVGNGLPPGYGLILHPRAGYGR